MHIKYGAIGIRSWNPEKDVDSLEKLANDEEIARNMSELFPYDPNKEIFCHHKAIQYIKEEQFKKNYAVTYQDSIAGGIGMMSGDADKDKGHVGYLHYWIGKNFHHKGIAKTALKMFTLYCFNNLPISRLEASVYEGESFAPFNEYSMRTLESAGYKREGKLRGNTRKGGIAHDEIVFGILPTDLRKHEAYNFTYVNKTIPKDFKKSNFLWDDDEKIRMSK